MKITSFLKNFILTSLFLFISQHLFAQQYIFFLHNKFIEEHGPEDSHPQYGKAEYDQILDFYTQENFVVISEKRAADTDGRVYAKKVAHQIDSLLASGVKASKITVIGTSKGGYIAQFVSSLMKRKDLNYVFIGSCGEEDPVTNPDINFSGNILSIYEKSDTLAQSCQRMKLKSGSQTGRFQEIELNTGLRHGFLFKAMPEWLIPSATWARGQQDSATEKVVGAVHETDPISKIDQLLDATTNKPFNGVVLIAEKGISKYFKTTGYSDLNRKKPFKFDDQFVIGSVSKQFTAVLLLLEYEKDHVKLNEPISTYLPTLTQSWAGTVTVHHLLTHMHGITTLEEPLAFEPGTKYAYSQIGYDLLARITERTTGMSFAEQSARLFRKCKMYNTFHPDLLRMSHLVEGYTEQENGKLAVETQTFQNFPAAGSFISTANDLLLWNQNLHGGKILSKKTYDLMISKKRGAERNHPIFGIVDYGYGITVDTQENILQLGQTGFAPGFISMNFYFPETKTSIIALDNTVWDDDDLVKAFRFHAQMLTIIRESNLVKEK